MDQARQQLLAGPALSQNQGASLGVGHLQSIGNDLFQRLALADQLVADGKLFFEVFIFFLNLLNVLGMRNGQGRKGGEFVQKLHIIGLDGLSIFLVDDLHNPDDLALQFERNAGNRLGFKANRLADLLKPA